MIRTTTAPIIVLLSIQIPPSSPGAVTVAFPGALALGVEISGAVVSLLVVAFWGWDVSFAVTLAVTVALLVDSVAFGVVMIVSVGSVSFSVLGGGSVDSSTHEWDEQTYPEEQSESSQHS